MTSTDALQTLSHVGRGLQAELDIPTLLPCVVSIAIELRDGDRAIAVEEFTIDANRSRLEDDPPSLRLSFQSLDDAQLLADAPGRLLPLLRSGRVGLDGDIDVALSFVCAIRPNADDKVDTEIRTLPIWVRSRSDREVEAGLAALDIEALLRHYLVGYASALGFADVNASLAGRTVGIHLTVGQRVYQGHLRFSADSCEPFLGDSLVDDMVFLWTDPLGFVRYLGRQVDIYDAIFEGSCIIEGNRELLLIIGAAIGRQPWR